MLLLGEPRARAIFWAACGFSVIIRIESFLGALILFGEDVGFLGCFLFLIVFLLSSRKVAGVGFPGDSIVVNSSIFGRCFTSFSIVFFASSTARKSFTAIFLLEFNNFSCAAYVEHFR